MQGDCADWLDRLLGELRVGLVDGRAGGVGARTCPVSALGRPCRAIGVRSEVASEPWTPMHRQAVPTTDLDRRLGA